MTTRDVARLPLPFLADLVVLVLLSRGGEWKAVLARSSDAGPALEEGVGRESVPADLIERIDRRAAGGNSTCPLARRCGRRRPAPAPAGKRSPPSPCPANRPADDSAASDLTLAEAYASRAAVALDNARLYHEVQQADRQKNEFLSMLAHELRNPLAPIRNANEVIRQKGSDPARVRWAQGVIDRQLTHLVRLVDDLLDVSRLTQGKIRLAVEPVVLDAVVAQAVEAARPVIDQFRHELEVELPLHAVRMTADKARLTQVLTNLLNNAAKYTDPGGRIWLTASVVAESGSGNSELVVNDQQIGSALHAALRVPPSEFLELRVRDTGVGIAPEVLPSVFDLFTQASRSLDRSQGGLGVGLTLVRRLVEMHGGTVSAHSEGLGKGAEFVARLPLAAAAGAPASRPAENDNRARPQDRVAPLRVVVVDDNVDGAESLANLLEMLGHQVRMAHDGPTGIDAVHDFSPHIVLLDIGLPGMNGFEVARRLRDDQSRSTCPMLVAVSGYGRDEDRKQAREAGFEHHFVKPVDFAALRALLDSLRSAKV